MDISLLSREELKNIQNFIALSLSELRELKGLIELRIYHIEEENNPAIQAIANGKKVVREWDETWVGQWQEIWRIDGVEVPEGDAMIPHLDKLWRGVSVGMLEVQTSNDGKFETFRIAE